MNTLTKAPIQLKITGAVLAIAALLVALLAVAMTVGPTMAQTNPYPEPKPCGPGQDPVPDSPDATVTSGHYGVFDGYWDFEKKTLNLNLCPPSVVHTSVFDPNTGVTTEVSTRTASNVDIQQTVFHINEANVEDGEIGFEHPLTAADLEEYDFFKLGDKDENGVDDADGMTVWWLKVDDESTPDVDEDSALAMGFSADLFDSQYWYLEDDSGTEVEPLQYEFEVIREPGIPIDEQGHVFAFDDSPAPTTGDEANIKRAFWDSSEVDANALPLYPGDYHHLQWAFTKPGTYVISVQLKGHVRGIDEPPAGAAADWKPISDQNVVTSEVKRYVFHVGPLADASVSVTANAQTPRPGAQVAFTVTAHNDGPDSAHDGIVSVSMPNGLTYVSSATQTGSYDSASGLWSVGALDASATADLTMIAEVDTHATLGQPLSVEAVITTKKSSGSSVLNELDPLLYNNTAIATVTPPMPATNGLPTVRITRSVAEDAAAGSHVGEPVLAQDPDADPLTFTLEGTGSENFTLALVEGGAQIAVSENANLDYETTAAYALTLQVSDGKDSYGNYDVTADLSFSLTIDITDVEEPLSVTLSASAETAVVGTDVTFTATVVNAPVPLDQVQYIWFERNADGTGELVRVPGLVPTRTTTYETPGQRVYIVSASYLDDNQNVEAVSNAVIVTWVSSSGG